MVNNNLSLILILKYLLVNIINYYYFLLYNIVICCECMCTYIHIFYLILILYVKLENVTGDYS